MLCFKLRSLRSKMRKKGVLNYQKRRYVKVMKTESARLATYAEWITGQLENSKTREEFQCKRLDYKESHVIFRDHAV